VARDAAFADLALDAALAERALSDRDSALATELVYGTLRWQRYLDWILAPHSRRPLDSLDTRARVALRVAAYQIAFLERVPAFAAVNDAVALAGPKAGIRGFVNAVLRSFARRGVREREPPLPRDPVEALATRCSFPTWLAARWIDRYRLADAEALMRAFNERPPLTLRANTLRVGRDALAERLAAGDGRKAEPTRYAPEGLILPHGGGAPAAWPGFAAGEFVVQDEASMLVARLLEPRPGDVIVDACAAPGTKTTHLAQLMQNRGRIVALDPQPARLARVTEAAARLGATIVETRSGPVERLAPELRAVCDAVLVDAPCSNLGVLRRNPEVKWRRRPEDITVAAERQREILAAAATMLKAGGRLVYATCSLEPEENDAVVEAFLGDHPDFRIESPASFPLGLDGGMLRIRPDRLDTDGFTAVRLRRA
jgi:16S rRNA (cytosine967-C5)-methyltransferase